MGCGAVAVASVCKHARTNSSANDRPKQRRFEPAKIEKHGLIVSANPATTAGWRYSIKFEWMTPQQWRAISVLRMDGDNEITSHIMGFPWSRVARGGAACYKVGTTVPVHGMGSAR